MNRYTYSAFDLKGNKTSGELDASSKQEAMQKVIELQLQPIAVKQVSSGFSLGLQRQPGLAELEYFTKEMAMLLAAGIRIDRAIGIIAKNHTHPIFAKLLFSIHKQVKQGMSLHKALAENNKLFEPLYTNMVAIGEASGNLAAVFSALADDLSFKSAMKKRTIQALTYPAVILVVCLLCLYFVFTFIVPQMSSIFENVTTLPWYTVVILSISEWLTKYDLLFLAAIVGAILLGVWAHRQGELAGFVHSMQMRMPVLKTVTRLVEGMRFNASMALMMTAGVKLDKALALAVGSLKHPVYSNELKAAAGDIRKGSSLSQTLANTRLYDDVYRSLLEVGEESGNLDSTFNEIAARQKSAFEDWTARMTALLEPLLIVFMGLVVGGVVVIMLLSMVTVNDISL